MSVRHLLLAAALAVLQVSWAECAIRALIVDGQNNHHWAETTPVLKKLLEQTGLFEVVVATSPLAGADMSGFRPEFSHYQAILSNYTGDPWPPAVREAFEKHVRQGGGFVVYHAANNAFPEWREYNLMTALGGWGNRDEKAGPYWYFREGHMVSDTQPGPAGRHGARKPFQIVTRNSGHPVTKGLPEVWMHAADELYGRLRGPGENLTLLATAFADPANKGSGQHEPMLFTVSYGKGRVFHTALGHDPVAMSCAGFIATLQRGVEWAATGRVTQKVPADFPRPDTVSMRPLAAVK